MPELPEVEVLVRHLRPLLTRRTIRRVEIRRLKSLGGTPARTFVRALTGATFTNLHRRGKYLIFQLSTTPHPGRVRSPSGPPLSTPNYPSAIGSAKEDPSAIALATADQLLVAPKSREGGPTINQSELSTLNSLSSEALAKEDQLSTVLLGHLGMTGRMYLLPLHAPLPRHAAVVLHFDRQKLVFEDTRYFGRLTLDTSPLERLGPEPLDGQFSAAVLRAKLNRSRQHIKAKLLDQAIVAGIGNIYASEALFRARISPRTPAGKLRAPRLTRLANAIRAVLNEAIAAGSTVPLNFSGQGKRDGLFYYGSAPGTPQYYEERLLVYDREKQPCPICRTPIRRITQSARSTYYCPRCQRS
jgi:formamidopyrimidine-DNA glycosylase